MTTSNSLTRLTGVAAIALAISGMPLPLVLAHEGHHMECSESSIQAMKADIQAMPDGNAKTTATKETESAQAMMQKKDMKACTTHLSNAMEAMEK